MSALRPMTIGITDEERAALAALARRTGQSQTASMRTALSRFLRGARHGHSRWVIAKINEEVAHNRGKRAQVAPRPAGPTSSHPLSTRATLSDYSHDTTDPAICGIRPDTNFEIERIIDGREH